MPVTNFRDLISDLEATDSSTDVYVTLWTGWRYHSRIDCGALNSSKPSQIRRIPLKLAKWLDLNNRVNFAGRRISDDKIYRTFLEKLVLAFQRNML